MSEIAGISIGRGGLNLRGSVRLWSIVLEVETGKKHTDKHMIHGRLTPFVGTERQKDFYVDELCDQAMQHRLPLINVYCIDMGAAKTESASGKQDVTAKILEFKQK